MTEPPRRPFLSFSTFEPTCESEGAQPPDWLQPALDVSLQALLDAQDQNGGWPQQIPAGGEHNAKYTFNDGAMQSAIEVLFKAYRQLGDHRFFTAAMNGAMFIIATQGPGLQAGWGQQYDKKLAVSSGRNFEPPGYASRETGEIVNTLLDLYLETGDERLAGAISRAVRWLAVSPIRPRTWARLYEIRTNRPIYGDRDGSVHYHLSEISEERRLGYEWQGSFTEVLRALERERILYEYRRRSVEGLRSMEPAPATSFPRRVGKGCEPD